jgi:nitroimidazol reductase NimA-like FMN-containing flavoprotein (pyridoxamine 5'-phosphate oxidase superfamily)
MKQGKLINCKCANVWYNENKYLNLWRVDIMRRKDREVLDDEKIDEIINKSKICRVGFNDNGEVYIVPMNFGYEHKDNTRVFYFHSAKVGRKIDLIKSNPKVGFEIDTDFEIWDADRACDFSAGYQSVIGTGVISELNDFESKKIALIELMNTMTGKREWTFDENMINAVAVFKLDIEKLSCKQHLR